MEAFRDENEQIEALRRWWSENGRATVIGIVLALGLGFGWQGWQKYNRDQADAASNVYQAMIERLASPENTAGATATELAQRLKSDYGSTTYAQFAALHLAAEAVNAGELADAQAQLRWVLGKAPRGSDMAEIAQLRLARVLAAAGEPVQALAILEEAPTNPYRAAYAVARGDVLLSQGRTDEARQAYNAAQALLTQEQLGVDVPSLNIKLQSLTPVPARSLSDESAPAAAAPETDEANGADSVDSTSAEEEG